MVEDLKIKGISSLAVYKAEYGRNGNVVVSQASENDLKPYYSYGNNASEVLAIAFHNGDGVIIIIEK